MIDVIAFNPDHANLIFDLREHYGMKIDYPADKLIEAYTSPGSLARTLMVNDMPCACGGIMNMGWNRGEAWLLDGPFTFLHPIALVKSANSVFLRLASLGNFRRVQATCFTEAREGFFRLLGFEYECSMKSFGPSGQQAYIYVRVFQ
jgi:hypothetical protein